MPLKKNQKIIIVGAGPVGCYLGQLLKSYGFNPLLIEEHPEVGRPVQCAGIVGRGLFEQLHLQPPKRAIQNNINGAIVSFNGTRFELKRPNVAYIIDRAIFDSELGRGLEIETNTELQEISVIKDGYLLKTSNGEYFADIVVGADGPNSRVRKALDFPSDMRLYRGYQYRIKQTPEKPDYVLVDYVKPFSFFTWLIPEGNGVARLGTICNNPYQELNNFMTKQGYQSEIIEKNAGAIPIGTCDLVKGQAALVGDAACQVKPITSGGIFYGLIAAEMLAEAIKNEDLTLYQTRWQAEYGQEIRICLLLRYIMENMDEAVLKRVFEYVSENARLIEQIGDFENHSSVIWSVLSNPRTYPTIGTVMMGLLKNPKFLLRSLFRWPR